MEAFASAFAFLGGGCIGTYPIFVKTRPVLDANIHPIIFQAYKSACVGLLGTVLITLRLIRGAEPVYIFCPWAVSASDSNTGARGVPSSVWRGGPSKRRPHWQVLSAAAWIPVGLTTITSVRLIGVGAAVFVLAGATSIFSFLSSWLLFHEPLKMRTTAEGTVYCLVRKPPPSRRPGGLPGADRGWLVWAIRSRGEGGEHVDTQPCRLLSAQVPVYMTTTVLGMAGLVFGPDLVSGTLRKPVLQVRPSLHAPASAPATMPQYRFAEYTRYGSGDPQPPDPACFIPQEPLLGMDERHEAMNETRAPKSPSAPAPDDPGWEGRQNGLRCGPNP